ncbi:sulfate transporter family-domain-containing protein [Phascolomyces articulosus]|uniref:Sulfate transporter family-domain-containing protein n=1 Tax=Phascolomyces articulosus TaxID=60185 RepID=A0AAD5K7Y0_9FUNG|nr:sulfate transporter family-domain-containing protein [Phascolomyces articulosus]
MDEDTDEETLPQNASETRVLLHNDDLIPRYMTASPLPSAYPYDNAPKDFWSLLKMRTKYYLPILQWLPQYNFNFFVGDFVAALTLSCLLIPQGLSYATQLCKIPAVYGLSGIAFPAITYAIFGMSRQMSVGPEAPLALLIGSSIAQQQHLHSTDVDPLAWSALTTLFVGLFTLLLGIFRLGFLDSLMSRALLRGFITGVALVVMVQQSITLLGLVDRSIDWGLNEASSSIDRMVFLVKNIQYADPLSSYVSGISVFILLSMRVIKAKMPNRRWVQLFPEVLIVAIASIVMTDYFDWDLDGLDILGDATKTSGLPLPKLPTFPENKHLKDMLVTAAMIAVIGFVESVAIAKTYSSRHNYTVSPNRELVALGVANVVSGICEGIPAFGSISRSKINDKAGARTQMAGLLAGVIALCAILFFMPFFYYLPKAVLSSIIFIAVLFLLSELPEDLHFIFKIGAWRDLALLLVTFLATMIISLEFGTLIAVTLSLLLTIKETSYPRISIMGRVKGTNNKFKPIHDDPEEIEHLEDVLIVRVEEPLFFANTGQLKDRLRRLEQFGDMSIHPSETPRLSDSSYIIFDVGAMPYIDASAVQILLEIVAAYHARNVAVYFVKVRERAMKLFEGSGLLELVGEKNLYRKVSDAIEAVEKDRVQRYGIPIPQ